MIKLWPFYNLGAGLICALLTFELMVDLLAEIEDIFWNL